MSTRPNAVEVLRLGLFSAACSAFLLSPAWAGQTFTLFKSDGTPVRAAPSTPASVPQTPAANIPSIQQMPPKQAEGDPDRPLVMGNVYNSKSSGPAAQQGDSKLPPVTIMKWGKFNPAQGSPPPPLPKGAIVGPNQIPSPSPGGLQGEPGGEGPSAAGIKLQGKATLKVPTE